ncbi:MAG: hypothetical protein AABZ36_01530 [Nitrospirota bacterium]
MKKKRAFLNFILTLICVQLLSGIVLAQQTQIVPVSPWQQTPTVSTPFLQGQPYLQQPQQTPPPSQQPSTFQQPSIEKPSEFEQYISGGAIDIDEFQFEILKKLEGIDFQYTARALPPGKIAIPIRIVKITKRVER